MRRAFDAHVFEMLSRVEVERGHRLARGPGRWLGCTQTFLPVMPVELATGIGNGSANPRTPGSVPK